MKHTKNNESEGKEQWKKSQQIFITATHIKFLVLRVLRTKTMSYLKCRKLFKRQYGIYPNAGTNFQEFINPSKSNVRGRLLE